MLIKSNKNTVELKNVLVVARCNKKPQNNDIIHFRNLHQILVKN